MKKLNVKKIKNWTKKNKNEIITICYGTGMLIIGLAIGYKTGYKKFGNITTIMDPKTNAVILTKRELSYEECFKLAGKIMKDKNNFLEALETFDVLL